MFHYIYYCRMLRKRHIQEVLSHPKIEFLYLSCNPNITWDIVIENIEKPWNWYRISMNPNITWEIVRGNSELPWDWHGVSVNPNITWEIIRDNSDIPWVWHELSKHPNITWDIIRDNPEKPWVWSHVSLNPNITVDIVNKNPDIPWDWGFGLSMNPNITWDMITENLDKTWCWEVLSTDDDGYEGAIVLEPKTGIYIEDPICVLDYASLYPSSMISENLSHDCIVTDPKYDNLPGVKYLDISYDVYEGAGDKKQKVGEKVCRFVQNEKGIIPRTLQKLLRKRKETRKKIEWQTVTCADGAVHKGLLKVGWLLSMGNPWGEFH